jgi:hypothetical protein
MSLEKLLIFGFALAVVAALTLSGRDMKSDREVQTDGYKEKVNGLAEMAR